MPRGLSSGTVLADDLAKASELSSRLRWVRLLSRRQLRQTRHQPSPQGRWHRPPPRKDRVHHQQRAAGLRDGVRRRVVGRPPLVVCPSPPLSACRHHPRVAHATPNVAGVGRHVPAAETPGLVLCRPHHDVRTDAGHGLGQRPPVQLPCAPRRQSPPPRTRTAI